MELIVAKSRYSRKLDSIMYETFMKKKVIVKAGTNVPTCDAVNKEVTNIDLSQINFVITKNTFPSYPGDFNKDTDGEYMLKEPYNYVKDSVFFDYNKKGLVTKGSKTIPTNSWVKFDFAYIDENLFPNTPEGMGIKNISKRNNGLTNNLLNYKKETGYPRPSSPVLASSAIAFFNKKVEYVIGDMVLAKDEMLVNDTNFEKVNGTLLNKTRDKEVFDIIGSTYGIDYGGIAKGKPWGLSVDHFTDVDVSLPFEFEEISFQLLNNLAGASIATIGQTIYLFGGYRGNKSEVSDDTLICSVVGGEIKKAIVGPKLPEKMCFGSSVVTESYVLLVGGVTNLTGNIVGCKCWKAKKLAGDKLGPWVETLRPLNLPTLTPKLTFVQNRLYVIGGRYIDGNTLVDSERRYYLDLDLELDNKKPWTTEVEFGHRAISNTDPVYGYASRGYNVTCVKSTAGKKSYSNFIHHNLNDKGLATTTERSLYRFKETDVTDMIFGHAVSIKKNKFNGPDVNSDKCINFYNTINGIRSSDTYISTISNSTAVRANGSIGPHQNRHYYNLILTSTSLYMIGGLLEPFSKDEVNSTSLKVLKHNYRPHDPTLMENWDETVKTVLPDPATFKLPFVDKFLFNGENYSLFIKVR